MKPNNLLGILAFSLLATPAIAQKTYNNKPLILANSEKAAIAYGKVWNENMWRISPEIANDVVIIPERLNNIFVLVSSFLSRVKLTERAARATSILLISANVSPAFIRN